MGQVDQVNVDDVFTYHAPEGDQIEKYKTIRQHAKVFANVILNNCPPCADRTAAIRKLRESVQIANASIALKGAI